MADSSFISPVWDIMPASIEDNSISEYSYVRYNTVEGRDTSNIGQDSALFQIVTKDLDSYLLPSKALLDFTFKVVKEDGTAITENSTQMIDNIMGIWAKSSHIVNSVPLCEVEEPVLTTTVANLLEYSPDYKERQGPAQWFYSGSGAFDATAPQVTRVGGSNLIRVLYPLNRVFGSLQAMTSVSRGLEHRFTFQRHPDSRTKRCLFGGAAPANQASRIVINEMSVLIPKLSPSPRAENLFLSIAKNKDLSEIINYEAANGYRQTLNVGTNMNYSYQITSSSKKPKYVFVCLQNQSRLEGAIYGAGTGLDRNPGIFDNLDLTSISLKINSKQFPYEAYRLEMRDDADLLPLNKASEYLRPYNDLLSIYDKAQEYDNGSCISYEEYRSKYPIFAWDVSKDSSLYENLASTYISVELSFRNNATNNRNVGNIYANAVIVFDRALTMSSDGSALKLTRD